MQADLFSVESLAPTVVVPSVPELVLHADWPFPGLTPLETARASLGISAEYADMVAAVVLAQGGAELTGAQVAALMPDDWKRELCNPKVAGISTREGETRGVAVRYVPHDGGSGFHFTYRPAGT
jgi:hypothetical protein